MPPPKELRFFSQKTYRMPETTNAYCSDLSQYLSYFRPRKQERLCGEADPCCLADDEAPRLIHKHIPDAKFVVLLRQPAERAYSYFLMLRNHNQIPHESFSAFIRDDTSALSALALRTGLYAQHLQRYFATFKRKQFLILFFEDLQDNPQKTMRRVCDFLHIDPKIHCSQEAYNKGGVASLPFLYTLIASGHNFARKTPVLRAMWPSSTVLRRAYHRFMFRPAPMMNEKDWQYLQQYYANDIAQVEQLTDRDLSHWKRPHKS